MKLPEFLPCGCKACTRDPYNLDDYPQKERTLLLLQRPEPIVRRNYDGAWFEPSNPGYPDYTHLLTEHGSRFFFRRIAPETATRWLGLRKVKAWRRTGELWCPLTIGLFNVIHKPTPEEHPDLF